MSPELSRLRPLGFLVALDIRAVLPFVLGKSPCTRSISGHHRPVQSSPECPAIPPRSGWRSSGIPGFQRSRLIDRRWAARTAVALSRAPSEPRTNPSHRNEPGGGTPAPEGAGPTQTLASEALTSIPSGKPASRLAPDCPCPHWNDRSCVKSLASLPWWEVPPERYHESLAPRGDVSRGSGQATRV